MHLTEVWNPIKGYEGRYEISNLGKIMSLNYRKTKKAKLLTPIVDRSGYYNVVLSCNGKTKRCLYHRLVAEAFIPNEMNYLEVNHKNENNGDNSVDNLEWCTRDYNMRHGTRVQRMIETKRKNKEMKSIDRPRIK